MGYRVIGGKLQLIEDIGSYCAPRKEIKSKGDFKDILGREIEKSESFVISNHAAERMKSRSICLNEADMKKINEGINKADEKGCSECLILYKDVAMVASIKNRTIITAMDKDSSKGNVFTNIDSVVLL